MAWFRTDMSHVMRKPAFCIFKNKDADQLNGNYAADRRSAPLLLLHSKIPLLPKSEISSFLLSFVAVQL